MSEPLAGILNLDKPMGMSSARAVAAAKRLLPKGTKIGHAGTLDPFASGVVLLLVGKATRCCESLMNRPKQYITTVRLGATTKTLDPETPEIPVSAQPVAREKIEALLPRFTGPIQQHPPAFSALKIAGRPAYRLARAGHAPQLEPRTVHIYAIELLDYAWPDLRLKIDCGRGTYIRALARDIGQALGTSGYLRDLRRTRTGEFTVESGVSLETLAADGVAPHLLPFPS